MTVDRARLRQLAEKARDAYPRMQEFQVRGENCLDVTAFMQAVDPETVLALLADLDRYDRFRQAVADLIEDLPSHIQSGYEYLIDQVWAALAEHGDVS